MDGKKKPVDNNLNQMEVNPEFVIPEASSSALSFPAGSSDFSREIAKQKSKENLQLYRLKQLCEERKPSVLLKRMEYLDDSIRMCQKHLRIRFDENTDHIKFIRCSCGQATPAFNCPACYEHTNFPRACKACHTGKKIFLCTVE